eukprot:2653727-Pyramimonas_sp.AAC.1
MYSPVVAPHASRSVVLPIPHNMYAGSPCSANCRPGSLEVFEQFVANVERLGLRVAVQQLDTLDTDEGAYLLPPILRCTD